MTADIDGLFPAMRARVRYMLDDPEAKRLGVWVVSAFRSIALQRQLFADAVRRYGSEAAARKWVAPPGKSNHGPMVDDHGRKPGSFGQAVDLGVEGHPAVSGKWPKNIKQDMDALCARFGLRSPMAWEDWHYEPLPGFVDSWPPPSAKPVAPVAPPPIRVVRNGDPYMQHTVIVTIDEQGNGLEPTDYPFAGSIVQNRAVANPRMPPAGNGRYKIAHAAGLDTNGKLDVVVMGSDPSPDPEHRFTVPILVDVPD